MEILAEYGMNLVKEMTDPEGPLTLSKMLEAWMVAKLGLPQPQVVGTAKGGFLQKDRTIAYATVDGGVFDNGGYSGVVKGLQQMFPDAKSGKRILAFDGNPNDVPRAMGV